MNKAIICGRLGRDPELRTTTTSGKSVCSFSVATDYWVSGEDGGGERKTEWHNVVTWGRTAENVARFLTKGREVLVEGRLQTRKWQDKDGNDRYSTEIVAERVQFVGSKAESATAGNHADPADVPF